MKQHRDFTQGIEAVRAWCEKNNVTPSKLAIGLGRDPSSMRRLLKGQRAPSLEFALDIQRATKGGVPLAIWGLWTDAGGTIVRVRGDVENAESVENVNAEKETGS